MKRLPAVNRIITFFTHMMKRTPKIKGPPAVHRITITVFFFMMTCTLKLKRPPAVYLKKVISYSEVQVCKQEKIRMIY